MHALKESFVWHCREIIARLEEAETKRELRLGDVVKLAEELGAISCQLELRSPPLEFFFERQPHNTDPALVATVASVRFGDPTGEHGAQHLIWIRDEQAEDGMPIGNERYPSANAVSETRAKLSEALTRWIRYADRPDFASKTSQSANDNLLLSTAHPQCTEQVSVVVRDTRGTRTLVIPPAEVNTYSGKPEALAEIILDIEAHTGTRLRDSHNPLWFLRLDQHFKERRDPHATISFADFCDMRHPDKVERVHLRNRHEQRESVPTMSATDSDSEVILSLGKRIRPLIREHMEMWREAVRQVLLERVQVQQEKPLIPFTRPLSRNEKMLILAAIHDRCAGGLEWIHPWKDIPDYESESDIERIGPLVYACKASYWRMIESDIRVLSAADLWNVEEFVTEFEREFAPVVSDNDSSGSGKISPMWVSVDLRAAASAAKDVLYSGMRLVNAAEDSSDSSNEKLVGAFRDALHHAQSARDLIRPLAKEFIAARRSLNRPVPTIGTSKDASAVGLCATWAYSLIDEFCHPEDDGKGNWGSTLILDPADQRQELSRNRLRGLPTPIRQKIEQEVDDELSAAEWLRQSNGVQGTSSLQSCTDHFGALSTLVAALDDYVEREESSDPSDPPERIDAGHDVHNAVIAVKAFYRSGKLPAPARIHWMDLLQISRGKRLTDRPNQEAMEAAHNLSQWGEQEIARIATSTPPLPVDVPPSSQDGKSFAIPAQQNARRERKRQWVAKAMLLVQEHPEWPDAEIARQVDIDKSQLSRCAEYKMAAAMARGESSRQPRGYQTLNSETGLHDIEAVAPPESREIEESGSRVPGSRFVREKCAECGEPIRVTPDQVGKNPVCSACKP